MTDEWGPPELCSPGLQIKATPTSRQSINQFPPRAPDQPINQSASQQMLLCLREGAGSGMVELVTQTQTQVSSFWKENDFMLEPRCVCTFTSSHRTGYFSLGLMGNYLFRFFDINMYAC